MWAFFVTAPLNIYMLETLEQISKTVKDFSSQVQFNDWLMAVGKKADTSNSREICIDANYVRGCTSNVWITGTQKESKWYFNFYSNTMFTNGIVYILCNTISGKTVDQVNQVEYNDYNFLGTNLSLSKKQGLQAMLNQIKSIANA